MRFTDRLGRHIGDLENGVFRKKVEGSKHRLNRPPAWAMDETCYAGLVRQGCQRIEILDTETGDYWRIPMPTFTKEREFIDRGYGVQCMVRLPHWEHTPHPKQAKLL